VLSALHIENIAVIEKLDIEFLSGFNVLTGETGAGKSIIIDALSAILGERTSRDIIRTGAERASVSAQFSNLSEKASALLADCGFAPDEDGVLIVRRDLYLDGKNSCRINGAPVTVSQLKAVGRNLIDIHGQHDGQKLLDEACHIDYLDRYCKNEELLSAYRKEYDQLRSVRGKINALLMDRQEKERKTEMLSFQISELKSAALKDGEEELLVERRELLKNAERISSGLGCAYALFYGDENQSGITTAIKEAEDVLSPLSKVGDRFRKLYEKAEELRYQAEDLASELRSSCENVDSSPDELQSIEERLDLIYRLKRKYGATISEMLQYLEKIEGELSSIETAEETIEHLKEQYKEDKARTLELAHTLHLARAAGASTLEKRIAAELSSLDMKNARFLIPVESEQTEKGAPALQQNGTDTVRFLITTNAGEAPKELNRVASGGELSRVMLALKNVLSSSDPVGTLIFDEVDAGVSGRAAGRVAAKLKEVSKNRQVLCVTHLAQIAACADSHFLIQKNEKGSRTYTEVTYLSFEERKKELARIIGGEVVTETTLMSAEELIKASNA